MHNNRSAFEQAACYQYIYTMTRYKIYVMLKLLILNYCCYWLFTEISVVMVFSGFQPRVVKMRCNKILLEAKHIANQGIQEYKCFLIRSTQLTWSLLCTAYLITSNDHVLRQKRQAACHLASLLAGAGDCFRYNACIHLLYI